MIKKTFIILDLALIAAVIFLGVKLFYGYVTADFNAATASAHLKDKISENRPIGKNNMSRSTGNQSFSAYQPIVERDLFKTGRSDGKNSDAINPSELKNLEKTKLSLKLWGTITGNAGRTYAVIEDTSKREQKLYMEGDAIQHARIRLVLRKKVVLTVDGRDEILEMQDTEDQGHRFSDVSAIEENPPEYDQEEMIIGREKIDESLEDINDLMTQIRIRPYFKGGKPSGLLLSGIQKDSIFEEMGLQSGDVVKGVNGKKLESVDDALQFYQNMRSASDVELEIEREGQSKVINYRID